MEIYLKTLECHQQCSVSINLFLVERRLHDCFAHFDFEGVENGSSCDGLKFSFVVSGPIASSHDAQQKTAPTTCRERTPMIFVEVKQKSRRRGAISSRGNTIYDFRSTS